MGESMCDHIYKGLISWTFRKQVKLNNSKKLAKNFNRYFSQEDTDMANKHLKWRSSTSPIIKETQSEVGDTTSHPQARYYQKKKKK